MANFLPDLKMQYIHQMIIHIRCAQRVMWLIPPGQDNNRNHFVVFRRINSTSSVTTCPINNNCVTCDAVPFATGCRFDDPHPGILFPVVVGVGFTFAICSFFFYIPANCGPTSDACRQMELHPCMYFWS